MLLISTEAARDQGWAAEIALGLARSWSGVGANVLIIDADPVEPTLHRLAHVENGTGISDALLFGSSIGGMAESVEDGRFRVVPAGSPMADPVGAFERPRWQELIDDLVAQETMVVVYSRADAEWQDALARLAHDLVLIAAPGDAGIAALASDDRLRAIYGIGSPDEDSDEDWSDPLAADPLFADAGTPEAAPDPLFADATADETVEPDPAVEPVTEPVIPVGASQEDEPDLGWEDVDLGPTRIPLAAFGDALAEAQETLASDEASGDAGGPPAPAEVPGTEIDPLDDMVWEDPPEEPNNEIPVVPEVEAAQEPDESEPFEDPAPIAAGPISAPDYEDDEDPLMGSGGEAPGWEAVDEVLQASTPAVPMPEAPSPALDLEDAPWERTGSTTGSRRLPAMMLGVAAIAVAGWFFWPGAEVPTPSPADARPASASPEATPPPETVATTAPGSEAVDPTENASTEADGPAAASPEAAEDVPMRYAAAFGSFRSPETAQRLRDEVADQTEGDLVLVVPAEVNGQLYYRVIGGAAPTGTESQDMMERLAGATNRSVDDLVLREVPMAFLMTSHDRVEEALDAAVALQGEGLPAYVLGGGTGPDAYRVMVGAFLDAAEASWVEERLVSGGRSADLVERRGRPVVR